MRSFAARLRVSVESLLVSQWVGYLSVFLLYEFIGAGLYWRRRGLVGPFEILALPAPALMIAALVATVMMARGAPIAETPTFRRWLKLLGWYIVLVGTTAADIWRRFDPDALTRKHPFPAPLLGPIEWVTSYLDVWKDLLKLR